MISRKRVVQFYRGLAFFLLLLNPILILAGEPVANDDNANTTTGNCVRIEVGKNDTCDYSTYLCKKSDRCMDFIFEGVKEVSDTTVLLQFVITNNCDRAFSDGGFELPEGYSAINPNSARYPYVIENPAGKPFYSLKFNKEELTGEDYRFGKSDTFWFSLTKGAYYSLDKMRGFAKAGTGNYRVSFDLHGCRPRISRAPGFGTVEVLNDSVVNYCPEPGFYGTDSFYYVLSGGCGNYDTAKVVVKVNGVLPVELISFTGTVNEKNQIFLSWETATEINNSHFIIQRSKNGRDFSSIGRVEGHGNSLLRISYSFTDPSPLSGIAYYRLKQEDYNGTVEFHRIIKVETGEAITGIGSVTIWPNPVKDDRVNIELTGVSENETFLYKIFDTAGNIKFSGTFPGKKFKLNTRDLAAAVYFVRIEGSGKVFYEKIIIR